jgi:hypothetical protein
VVLRIPIIALTALILASTLLAACDDGGGGTPIDDPVCGDGVAETGEACDGADFAGLTCASFDQPTGELACKDDCTLDVSGCRAPDVCGDGRLDAEEACDGEDFGALTCASFGFDAGTLTCTPTCTIDVTTCGDTQPECGNNLIEGDELCDGADLDGRSCATLGFDGGQLGCALDCRTFLTDDCTNASQEICNNYIDDDGDGAMDCADPDCATHPSCQVPTCTTDDIYYDSAATCPDGSRCGVDENLSATCLPDALFAGGTFYGACGPGQECPFGSFCAGPTAGEAACMPFCHPTDHPACPQGGTCMYSLIPSDLYVCALPDNCDPVDDTGCTAPEGCYIVSFDGAASCVTAGNGVAGDPCMNLNDCAPGHLCLNYGTCHALCDADAPCSSGACDTSLGLPNGWGVCP